MIAMSSVAVNSGVVISNVVITDTVKEKAKEGSLKLVMQGLLKSTQQLTAGMLNEDFTLIAANAKIIADHPKPSMATRMKIMKAMGAEMVKFKANDDIVHSAAINIMTNAEQKKYQWCGVNTLKR